jgi:hypothetical protein
MQGTRAHWKGKLVVPQLEKDTGWMLYPVACGLTKGRLFWCPARSTPAQRGLLRMSRFCSAGFFCIALMMLAGAFPAWAALGGDTVSILADQTEMQGTRTTMMTNTYTLHEIQGANGTTVREYQSADGKVFAVAWNGQWMPNLQQILGSYYEQYNQALKAQKAARRGRGPVVIAEPDLNVEIGGHPRWFVGRAYIPGQLPPGMSPEDIR